MKLTSRLLVLATLKFGRDHGMDFLKAMQHVSSVKKASPNFDAERFFGASVMDWACSMAIADNVVTCLDGDKFPRSAIGPTESDKLWRKRHGLPEGPVVAIIFDKGGDFRAL